jgi:uncharacterized protein (DUF952 family)
MVDEAADPEGVLVHLCTGAEWAAMRAAGQRSAAAAGGGEFVHLSAPRQVHLPANRLFAGRHDLVLLWLDPGRLAAPVRWEPGVADDPAAMLFPHLYGPIPAAAVVRVSDYRPEADGSFAALSDGAGPAA